LNRDGNPARNRLSRQGPLIREPHRMRLQKEGQDIDYITYRAHLKPVIEGRHASRCVTQ